MRGGGFTESPNLHFILSEVNDRQRLPHNLPVTLVIDGGDLGTLALERKHRWVAATGTMPLGGINPAPKPLTFTRYK